ncbi:MAG: 50S ribosomal protein L29 [Chlamydiia bacterium]|nr:50S ribosomal protein L29 [Chlamydiia bacterium]
MSKQAKELRDLSADDLGLKLKEFQRELFEIRNKNHVEKKNAEPAQTKNLKKGIARILTILREKELGINA